ncbi:MAG: tetratricopeptide repeat protein [Candidatus Sumerlaeia bacterium]|nr:tetratricopeptide repeat protein [Candidatus Sumerlaeia bacterium]
MMRLRSARNHREALLAGMLALLLAVATGRPAVGDLVPPLDGAGIVVKAMPKDAPTTGPVVLVFLKPGDAHAARIVEDLHALRGRDERLARSSSVVAIISRFPGGGAPALPTFPKDWRVLHDTQDTLYTAYRIIATPSVAVVGSDKRLVGFHPGYGPALAAAIRRDLMLAIDGAGALVTPTPSRDGMNVQMGRALARRGLWERALGYYRKAAEEGELSAEAQLEMATLHLELGERDDALRLLEALAPAHANLPGIEDLRRRLTESVETPLPKPPPVP